MLLKDWDPIGVDGDPDSADEYDSYLGDFYEELVTCRSRRTLIARLSWLESEYMGLSQLKLQGPARLETVADALLRIPIRDH